jgi:hypothetical protein
MGQRRGGRPGAGDMTGRRRGGQPVGGVMGQRHGGHPDIRYVTEQRRAGDATGRRRGGRPGAEDGTERRRVGDATSLRLAVLHRVDPSVVVSSDGGAGRWRRRRWSMASVTVPGAGRFGGPYEYELSWKIWEVLDFRPQFRTPQFRTSAREEFFCTGPQFLRPGLISGLGSSCSKPQIFRASSSNLSAPVFWALLLQYFSFFIF